LAWAASTQQLSWKGDIGQGKEGEVLSGASGLSCGAGNVGSDLGFWWVMPQSTARQRCFATPLSMSQCSAAGVTENFERAVMAHPMSGRQVTQACTSSPSSERQEKPFLEARIAQSSVPSGGPTDLHNCGIAAAGRGPLCAGSLKDGESHM